MNSYQAYELVDQLLEGQVILQDQVKLEDANILHDILERLGLALVCKYGYVFVKPETVH